MCNNKHRGYKLDPNGKVQIKCHGFWNEAGKYNCQVILVGTRQEIGRMLNRCDSCRKEYTPLVAISHTKNVTRNS